MLIGINYYNYLNKIGLILLFYLCINLTIDIIGKLMYYYEINNVTLFNIVGISEIIIFSIFYLNILKNKKLIYFLSSIGVIYSLVEIVLINSQNIVSFQSYAKVISAFIIITISLYYIMNQLLREKEIELKQLVFVIISYFSLELIFLLPLNFLVNNTSNLVVYIWLFRLSCNLLFYSFLIYTLWKNGKTQKQLSSGL